jgi:hypothetical protein
LLDQRTTIISSIIFIHIVGWHLLVVSQAQLVLVCFNGGRLIYNPKLGSQIRFLGRVPSLALWQLRLAKRVFHHLIAQLTIEAMVHDHHHMIPQVVTLARSLSPGAAKSINPFLIDLPESHHCRLQVAFSLGWLCRPSLRITIS